MDNAGAPAINMLQVGELYALMAPSGAFYSCKKSSPKAKFWLFIADEHAVVNAKVIVEVLKSGCGHFFGFRSLHAEGKMLQACKEHGTFLRFTNYNFDKNDIYYDSEHVTFVICVDNIIHKEYHNDFKALLPRKRCFNIRTSMIYWFPDKQFEASFQRIVPLTVTTVTSGMEQLESLKAVITVRKSNEAIEEEYYGSHMGDKKENVNLKHCDTQFEGDANGDVCGGNGSGMEDKGEGLVDSGKLLDFLKMEITQMKLNAERQIRRHRMQLKLDQGQIEDLKRKVVEAEESAISHRKEASGIISALELQLKDASSKLSASEYRVSEMEKQWRIAENQVNDLNDQIGSLLQKIVGLEELVAVSDAKIRDAEEKLLIQIEANNELKKRMKEREEKAAMETVIHKEALEIQFNEKLAVSVDRCMHFEKTAGLLAEKVSTLENSIAKMNLEAEQYRGRIQELELEAENCRNAMAELEESLSVAEAMSITDEKIIVPASDRSLDTDSIVTGDLEEANTNKSLEVEDVLLHLQERNAYLERMLSQVEENRSIDTQSSVKSLECQLKDANAKLEELALKLESSIQGEKELEERLKSTEERKHLLESSAKYLNDSILGLKLSLGVAKVDCETTRKEKDEFKLSLEEAEKKASLFETKLKMVESKLVELENKESIIQHHVNVESFSKDVPLEIRLTNVGQKYLQLEEDARTSKEMISSLQEQLAVSNMEVKTMSSRLSEAEKKISVLNAWEEKGKELEVLVPRLKEDIIAAQGRATEAESKLQEAVVKESGYRDELSANRLAVNQLRMALFQAEGEKASLAVRIDAETRSFTQLSEKLRHEREQLQSQIAEIVREKDTVTQKYASLVQSTREEEPVLEKEIEQSKDVAANKSQLASTKKGNRFDTVAAGNGSIQLQPCSENVAAMKSQYEAHKEKKIEGPSSRKASKRAGKAASATANNIQNGLESCGNITKPVAVSGSDECMRNRQLLLHLLLLSFASLVTGLFWASGKIHL